MCECAGCLTKKNRDEKKRNNDDREDAIAASTALDLAKRGAYDVVEFRTGVFVLYYVDVVTKYTILKTISVDNDDAIASILFQIFCDFGMVPNILEGSNSAEVIGKLQILWPEIKIVSGETSLDKTFFEAISKQIKELDLSSQSLENKIKIIQLKINNTRNEVGQCPYFLTFNRNIAYNNSGNLPNFCNDDIEDNEDNEDEDVASNKSSSVDEDLNIASSSFCQCSSQCMTKNCSCKLDNIKCGDKCHIKSKSCKNK